MVDVQNIEAYQQLLNQLPGILNSRIIIDDEGNPMEVHILSDDSRSPKQIVRDVQSALLANNNLKIDHKIISVAQIEGKQFGIRESRMSIDSIQMFSKHTKVHARVLLKKGDQTFEGSSTGGNTAQGRMRVLVEATLNAVHSFLNKDLVFELSDVVQMHLANRKAVTVSILHLTEKNNEHLSGSAFVKDDENETVVKATLDAINRRLVTYSNK